MTTLAASLDAAVRAVCPAIDGVSIGRKDDRSTWKVHFRPEATAAQREAAQSVINGFDAVATEARGAPLAELSASDAGLIRTIEDLISTLVAKGVIAEADLPAAARTKLARRRQLRQQLA